MLVQLSGTKRFTLVAPGPLHGLPVYPSVLRALEMRRDGPGAYAAEGAAEREESHFALVDDPARPDLHRHPLGRYAAAVDVDVEEGCALLLPAYWYHRVESSAPPDRLNVAVNVWFDADVGGGAPARLHRMLRERLLVDCT